MISLARGHQSGRRIQEDDIPPRRFLSTQYFANDGGVSSSVSSCEIFDARSFYSKFFWRHFISPDRPFADFRNACGTSHGDFIQAIASMHN